ncbi:Uncharacterised protein [Vibrio cholerae]|nr:Uncharacterised protein [Vibrio cholerae]
MSENISVFTFRANKTEAFGIIKPFHCTCSHAIHPSCIL